MNDETLIRALHQITVVDNLRCFGCGYEHHCSTHGCAIIKEAVERLQALTAPQPNEPLTLEELRKMEGQPVWVISAEKPQKEAERPQREWALVRTFGPPRNDVFLTYKIGYADLADFVLSAGGKVYRHNPEAQNV